MKYSSKRLFTIFISALFFIAAAASYSYFISPAYEEVQILRGEQFAKEQKIVEFGSVVKKIKDLLASYKSAAEVQQNISAALPDKPEIPQALFQLNSLARADNLDIISLSAKESAVIPSSLSLMRGVGVVVISIQATGGYEQLKSFLNDLESNIRIFDVKNLRVEKTNVSDVFNINSEISVYYQAQ